MTNNRKSTIIKVNLIYGEENIILFDKYRTFKKREESNILDTFPPKIIAIGRLVTMDKVFAVFDSAGNLCALNQSYLKEIEE